ncbi:MAG: hypothetical protein NUW37_18115 [Planctomycetes bacterium]|nr:hypothetical protein [Planctomycetota bacterium]
MHLKAEEGADPQAVDLTGLWSISMTLENVTATYELSNAYAIAQQGEVTVTVQQVGSTLIFTVPDPTVSVTGTVDGTTVTLHLSQELPEEAQADTFVADIVFQTDIPFCNETFGYYEMEGTYSGTGYIMFQPENLEYKIPDFCTWSGIFEAFVVATDDPPEPGSVAHIIADGSIETLRIVDEFNASIDSLEKQVIDDILYAPSDGDAKYAYRIGLERIEKLAHTALKEIDAVFASTRSGARDLDPGFRKNLKQIWDCYMRSTSSLHGGIKERLKSSKRLVSSYYKNGGPANLPATLNRLSNRTNATATNGLSVVAGTQLPADQNIPEGVTSMIFLVETNEDCGANDIDFVQFISYDWSFVKLEDDKVENVGKGNGNASATSAVDSLVEERLSQSQTSGEGRGAGEGNLLVPPDFSLGQSFPDVPLSDRQNGNPSYPVVATQTYNGTEYKGMEDPPHIGLSFIYGIYDTIQRNASGEYANVIPPPNSYNGMAIIQSFDTSISPCYSP